MFPGIPPIDDYDVCQVCFRVEEQSLFLFIVLQK
jgi:hypothetical protein